MVISGPRMNRVQAFGVLLIGSFVGVGLPLIIGTLLGVPLIRWTIYSVLYFPVTGPELLRLTWLVLGLTAVVTLVLWFEGLWKRRW